MPKIAKTEQQRMRDVFRSEVKRAMVLAGIRNQSELADRIGMSRPTLSTRLQNCGEFKVQEIIRLCNVLNISPKTLFGERSERA